MTGATLTARPKAPPAPKRPRSPGRPARCYVCGTAGPSRFETPFDVSLWACESCGTRFVHPVPDTRELARRYEDEHSAGKWVDLFDQQPPEDTERRARTFASVAGRPGRVLDVGFGDGRFLDCVARLGWETWGLEVSPAAARLAAGRHQVVVGDLATFRRGPAFDAVTFWDVLEHVPDPAAMARAAAELLAPGGIIAATMPNVMGTESIRDEERWRYYDFATYGHLHHMGPEHVSALFARAGLETVYAETRGSIDLRDSLAAAGHGLGVRTGRWILDRVSGLVARIARIVDCGNTLMVIARKPDARGGRR